MSTATPLKFPKPEIWGGIECTINRVGDCFNDQLVHAGHYNREDDLEKIASLGMKKLRYPVLWEHHQPTRGTEPCWTWSRRQLEKIRDLGMDPIVGLLHHGSGPVFTQLDDDNFPELLAGYAYKVAKQFPWVEYYTPVNEPMTTARFSGLYGFWYPHAKNDQKFAKMLINQLKGVVLCMQEIRKINPAAKLVQTEDLGYTHSTSFLQYQADFENIRRWLTFDILCGRMDTQHRFWEYFISNGITRYELDFFLRNPCPPGIMGLNYYVTSERYLDQRLQKFPPHTHGGNNEHRYADTEAVRTGKMLGLEKLLEQVFERYRLPVAVTECHLHCSREEQLRWVKEAWDSCVRLSGKGIDVRALTIWSLLGAYDWNSLLTRQAGNYEPGVFDVSDNSLRQTATAKLVSSLASTGEYQHPLLMQRGWWNKPKSIAAKTTKNITPLLIIGKTGTLGNAFSKVCDQRSIAHVTLSRQELDICEPGSIDAAIEKYRPWAIINATGFVRVDDAETNRKECFLVNCTGPNNLAEICAAKSIPLMTFSSDLVFDGCKNSPYLELDRVQSLNVYGASKAKGEKLVQAVHPKALIIRTSGFFGPWDRYNFAYGVLDTLRKGEIFTAAGDIITSPTYVPDLVNAALDLFIDEEAGIWHLANDGVISWYDFAREVALHGGCELKNLRQRSAGEMEWRARRPLFSALQSEKGIRLPTLENALERYFLQHNT